MSRKKLILLVALGTFVAALPFLVSVGAAGLAVYAVSRAPQHSHGTIDEPGARLQRSYDLSADTHSESRGIQGPDGSWVKNGPSVIWSRSEMKLAEGSYRDGKRDGPWTYWNEDGSIDTEKSGVYEGDVRVSDPAPSPIGDYPLDTDASR